MENHNEMKVLMIHFLFFLSFLFIGCQREAKTLEEVKSIFGQGLSAYKKGKYSRAIEKFEQVISLTSPQSPFTDKNLCHDASYNKIISYEAKGDSLMAVSACEEWLNANPCQSSYKLLAWLYNKQGNKAKAQKKLEEALSKGFKVHGQLAEIHSDKGEHDLAIHHFEEAIKYGEKPDNKNTSYYIRLSEEAIKVGDKKKALNALADGILVSGDSKEKFMEMIRNINQLSGDFMVNQEKTLKELTGRAPNEAYFRNALIELYLKGGYDEKAEAEIDKALSILGKEYEKPSQIYFDQILSRNCDISIIDYKVIDSKIIIYNKSGILDWDNFIVHLYNTKENDVKAKNDFSCNPIALSQGEHRIFTKKDFKNDLGDRLENENAREVWKIVINVNINYKGIKRQLCAETFNFLNKTSLVNCSSF